MPGDVIVTPRARLRRWTAADAPRLYDIRRLPEVATWLGDPTPWVEVAQASARIQAWQDLRQGAPGFGEWAIHPHDADVPVGSANLTRQFDGSIHVGWYLHPDSIGRGWAREAGAALLTHAWSVPVSQVWAVMWTDNDASAAVARALGMTDLGVRPDPWYGTPEDPDSLMFRSDAPLDPVG